MNKHFKQGTRNASIFNTTAPYANSYQGSYPRWLFVCSAGLLRSPTAASLAAKRNINARSCGSSIDYALVPISANLVMWAEKIVFVDYECYVEALDVFKDDCEEVLAKLRNSECYEILEIPDVYEYLGPELILHLKKQLFNKYDTN
jgi:predicted protein tyrosine phosphatase